MNERAERWARAWESRDADRVAAMYAEDATHASSLVPQLYPEIGGSVLSGREQIREYARRGLGRFTELRFEIQSVIDSDAATAIEYRRRSNLDGGSSKHVLELLEWSGTLIRAARVFHF